MDHMQYIFGPVSSRRFGNSLGINIVPFKVCSYDCIYCEVGKTTKKIIEQKPYVVVDELIEEFKESGLCSPPTMLQDCP